MVRDPAHALETHLTVVVLINFQWLILDNGTLT
jgi:hypothetical protein